MVIYDGNKKKTLLWIKDFKHQIIFWLKNYRGLVNILIFFILVYNKKCLREKSIFLFRNYCGILIGTIDANKFFVNF